MFKLGDIEKCYWLIELNAIKILNISNNVIWLILKKKTWSIYQLAVFYSGIILYVGFDLRDFNINKLTGS